MVYIDQYGISGSNFYWDRADAYDLAPDELIAIGIKDNRVMVHEDIINPLLEADKKFQTLGLKIYIKDGYRSKELYELVYGKRVKKFGKEITDKLMNISSMPHSTGKSVDISLIDSNTNKEISFRNKDDGTDALFIDFYKNKKDELSTSYQKNQKFLIDTMEEAGFRIGGLREYFHFNYEPRTEKNY